MPGRALLTVLAVALTLPLIVLVAGRPRPPQRNPLSLEGDGLEREATVRDRQGRVVLANFRTVEPSVLYRGSAFARADDQPFAFLRSLNVTHVVALEEDRERFHADEGYLRFWSERTGYRIRTTWLPVPRAAAYGRDDRSALHAAAELLSLMKGRRRRDGAVFVHGESGKDATGVVVAAYELWRNRGRLAPETLWAQVLRRYLLSNRLLAQDAEAAALADPRSPCARQPPSFVCPEWLTVLRSDLEYLARL